MKKDQDLVMNVSQEELMYLLNVMGGSTLPGIEPNIFEGATERDIAIAVGVAERALIARGFVIPRSDGKVEISEVPFALIGTCALPKYSVITETTTDETSQGMFWHGTENIIVEHNLPLRGIHKFRALADPGGVEEHIADVLPKLPLKAFSVEPGSLPDAVFAECKDLIRDQGDTKKAEVLFQEHGLPESTSSELVKAIHKVKFTISIGFIKHEADREAKSIGGVAIISAKTAFLVELDENKDELSIQSIGEKDWRDWLSSNFKAVQ